MTGNNENSDYREGEESPTFRCNIFLKRLANEWKSALEETNGIFKLFSDDFNVKIEALDNKLNKCQQGIATIENHNRSNLIEDNSTDNNNSSKHTKIVSDIVDKILNSNSPSFESLFETVQSNLNEFCNGDGECAYESDASKILKNLKNSENVFGQLFFDESLRNIIKKR